MKTDRPLAALAFISVGLLLPTPAGAEETICDPENPACVQAEPDEAPAESGDTETICDPENPACVGSAQQPTLSGPQIDAELEQPEPSNNIFDRTRFLGEWGSQLAVDSAFDQPGEDIVEAITHFDLGVEFEPRDDLKVVVEGQFRHWVGGKENVEHTDLLLNAQDVRASYDARLGEAYVLWRFDNVSVGVGNIITRWGSTDLVRPGDILNPTDQTSFSALDAAERIPQLTADLSYTGRGWSVQGLLVPFFVGDRVWAFGRDTSLFNPRNPVVQEQFPVGDLLGDLVDPSIQDDIQPIVGASKVPDEVPNNLSLGARFTATVANTDVGVGVWRGWDRTPSVFIDDDLRTLLQTVISDGQVLEDLDFLQFFVRNPELLDISNSLSEKAAAGEEIFSSEHRRQHMVLIDAARYIGPIGVRLDVAAFPQKTYMTEDFQPVRRPTLAPALGLSWERIQSEDDVITVTVEGFWQKPFAADDPLTESLVKEADRGSPDDPLLVVNDGLYGVAGAFLWSIPWIKTQVQLGGVYNVSHGDVIGSVQLSRTFFEWLTLGGGYTFFEGPDPTERLTLGGLYDNNDHFNLAISGVF